MASKASWLKMALSRPTLLADDSLLRRIRLLAVLAAFQQGSECAYLQARILQS
jgi:hypothetical protein